MGRSWNKIIYITRNNILFLFQLEVTTLSIERMFCFHKIASEKKLQYHLKGNRLKGRFPSCFPVCSYHILWSMSSRSPNWFTGLMSLCNCGWKSTLYESLKCPFPVAVYDRLQLYLPQLVSFPRALSLDQFNLRRETCWPDLLKEVRERDQIVGWVFEAGVMKE